MNRIKRCLLRHGFVGCVILAARTVAQYLSAALYRHERHVWYAADPAALTSDGRLPLGFTAERSGREDLALLSDANLYGWSAAESFLEEGGELWIVRDGKRAAGCCWIFPERVPTVAARGGWKDLPSRTVCLEGAVTGPDYRGRGLAPAAWSLIARRLKEQGVRTIITKVEEANTSMRRAVRKAGFQEVAVMDYLQVLGLSRVRVDPVGEVVGPHRDMLMEVQKLAV
jgi:RimJ/RimL family protein N-acetyltransferase